MFQRVGSLFSFTRIFFFFFWKCAFPLKGRLQENKTYVSDWKVGGQEMPAPYKASHGIVIQSYLIFNFPQSLYFIKYISLFLI